MAFKKKTWTDRVAEFINRRILTKEDGSTELVSVARSEGNISVEGDAFNAENMNDLEQRIADEFASQNVTFTNSINQLNTDLGNVGKGMTVILDYTSAFLAISYEYTELPISYDITQFRTILFDVWIEPTLLSRCTQEVSVIALRNEFPVIIQSSSQASTPYAISFLSSGTGLIYASSGNPVHCRIVGIK